MLSIDGYISLRGLTNRVKLFIATEFIKGREEDEIRDFPGVWPYLRLNDKRATSKEVHDNFEGVAQNMVLRTLRSESAILRILTPRGDLVKVSASYIYSDYWPVFARNNNPGFDPDWYAARSFDAFKEHYWKQQFLEHKMFRREQLQNRIINWRYGVIEPAPDDHHENDADKTKKAIFGPYKGCPIMVDEALSLKVPSLAGNGEDLADNIAANGERVVSDLIVEAHDENPNLTKRPIKDMLAPDMSDYSFEFHWKVAVDQRPALGRRGRR